MSVRATKTGCARPAREFSKPRVPTHFASAPDVNDHTWPKTKPDAMRTTSGFVFGYLVSSRS